MGAPRQAVEAEEVLQPAREGEEFLQPVGEEGEALHLVAEGGPTQQEAEVEVRPGVVAGEVEAPQIRAVEEVEALQSAVAAVAMHPSLPEGQEEVELHLAQLVAVESKAGEAMCQHRGHSEEEAVVSRLC